MQCGPTQCFHRSPTAPSLCSCIPPCNPITPFPVWVSGSAFQPGFLLALWVNSSISVSLGLRPLVYMPEYDSKGQHYKEFHPLSAAGGFGLGQDAGTDFV